MTDIYLKNEHAGVAQAAQGPGLSAASPAQTRYHSPAGILFFAGVAGLPSPGFPLQSLTQKTNAVQLSSGPFLIHPIQITASSK